MNPKGLLICLGLRAVLVSGAPAQTTGDRIDLYFARYRSHDARK
jgi:hypothetical protein